MRRWQTWLGVVLIVAFCGCGTAVLAPVFWSAKAAARMAVERDSIRRFRDALLLYAERHGGRLPGKDWKRAIRGVDPTVAPLLDHREEGGSTGLAAVPGVLGRRLDDFPDDAILFVGYRAASGASLDVLASTAEVGDAHRAGSAFALTAGRITNGSSDQNVEPNATIGYRLARQGARLSR